MCKVFDKQLTNPARSIHKESKHLLEHLRLFLATEWWFHCGNLHDDEVQCPCLSQTYHSITTLTTLAVYCMNVLTVNSHSNIKWEMTAIRRLYRELLRWGEEKKSFFYSKQKCVDADLVRSDCSEWLVFNYMPQKISLMRVCVGLVCGSRCCFISSSSGMPRGDVAGRKVSDLTM